MRIKKIVGVLLAATLLVTSFTGCDTKETADTGEKMTISVGFTKAENSWKNDDYYKYIADKLNIDIEFRTLSADSVGEKSRIWISSGDMPDVTYSDFLLEEYLKYGQQGMVAPLPEGWEEKYPNLGFSMAMTGAYEALKKAGNGEFYGLLVPMDHYSEHLDDFRTAYENGENLKDMMSSGKYTYIDKYGFSYRKDWAEQLGIKTDLIMDYDDFMDMALKFKEADLGGVGEKNTIGIAVDFTEAPNIFVTVHNPSYKYFHKNEKGEFVSGLLDDETTDGIVAYAEAFRKGILSPDFYTQKSTDLNALFCSQRAGIIFPRAEVSALRNLRSDFEKSNPGKKAEDCIGVCWIRLPDGTVSGREAGNYYRGWYFNPDLSEEKLDRILQLADYVSSAEGGPQIRLGVPDVDYKKEADGTYTILREQNEDGTYPNLNEKYPSYDFFRYFLNPQYTMTVQPDPYMYDLMNSLTEAKLSNKTKLLNWDLDRDFYTAEDYARFNAAYDVNNMFAEIIVSDGDIEKLWLKKRSEFEKEAKKVADNMNKAIFGR